MKLRLIAILVLLANAGTMFAQGSRKDDIVLNAQGRPMAGATVRVCTSAATGQPCSPLALVYADLALTQALANPLSTDGLGNYTFYALPGRYMIEISGPGITTKQTPNVILPIEPTSNNTFTGVETFNGDLSTHLLNYTVATLPAPASVMTGLIAVVTDATSAGSCTAGGGSAISLCRNSGSAWVTLGGVGGSGASLSADNAWTLSQRFKGPIPWRDITAYMPAGGCSSTAVPADPTTTGSITSGTSTLTLAAAGDFKTGCGVAVVNAGPTATIMAPIQGCAITSIARAANVVTVTCTAAHNIPQGVWDHSAAAGIQITGVTDSSYNGTFPTVQVADATHFTYSQTGANSSSASGTATMQFGYAHGVTGATTYNYKVSAVDALGGMSAASAAITITTGNAALNTNNYNWINFGLGVSGATDVRNQPQLTPHEWVIYSDKGLGGAYSCVGASFTNAYTDFGMAMPCPAFAPATPPAAATAQVLNAIINAGGGTTTLTLSATASNTATSQKTYHDETSFLVSCVNDDLTFRNGGNLPGSYGCYIPAGNYFFNGQMPSDNLSAQGTSIYVSGSLSFNIFPWYFSKDGFHIKGIGETNDAPSFYHAQTTGLMTVAPSLAAAVVIRNSNSDSFSNLEMPNLLGHGIWIGQTPYLKAPSSYRFDDLTITEQTGGAGAPMVFDGNSIGVWAYNSTLTPSGSAVGLPAIWETVTSWNVNVNCCMYFNGLSTVFRGVKFDAPGGNGSGGGHNSFYFRDWVNESLTSSEIALIVHDDGPNAPGATSVGVPLLQVHFENVNNSDPVNGPGAYAIFAEMGPNQSIQAVTLDQVNVFGETWRCGPANTAAICKDAPSFYATVLNSTTGTVPGGVWGGGLNITTAQGISAELPIFSKQSYNNFGAVPAIPAWAEVMPAPNLFVILSTGAGSLAAATYCMAVESKDARGGLTLPTNTLCQLVGASASISFNWQEASGNLAQGASGFRFTFCSTGGSSCTPNTYLDIAGQANPAFYIFTSTAGGTAQALNTIPTAYLSWLQWRGVSCLFCSNNPPVGTDFFQLGIGDPNPPTTSKVSIAGEFNLKNGPFRAQAITAPTCVVASGKIWYDSALVWKFCNEAGAPQALLAGAFQTNGTANTLQSGLNCLNSAGVSGINCANPATNQWQLNIANMDAVPGARIASITETSPRTGDVVTYDGTGKKVNGTLGLPIPPVTTTPFAILTTHRNNALKLASGAVNLTIVAANSAGFDSNFSVRIWNQSAAAAVTLTPTTSNITGGSTSVVAAASAVINPGDDCTLTSDNTNYFLICRTAGSISPVFTPGTAITLVAPKGNAVCTGTCTVTVPVPAAGYEFCAMADDNVAATITLSALGSSAQYENTARTAYGTAGTGTLAATAVVANRVCILGRDATHYLTTSFNGTWTAN